MTDSKASVETLESDCEDPRPKPMCVNSFLLARFLILVLKFLNILMNYNSASYFLILKLFFFVEINTLGLAYMDIMAKLCLWPMSHC